MSSNKTAIKRLPKFWDIESNNAEAYDTAIDEGIKYKDKPAVLICSTTAGDSDYFNLEQAVEGNAWYGKRIRISCFVRTEDVDSGATRWVYIQAPQGNMLVYDPMCDRPLKGTNDWTEMSVVVDVPPDGRWISDGPGLYGTGKMWVANFKVEEVSKDVERTDDHGSSQLLQVLPLNLDFTIASESDSEDYVPLFSAWTWSREKKSLKFSGFIKTENIQSEAVLVLMVNGVHSARLALSRMDSLVGSFCYRISKPIDSHDMNTYLLCNFGNRYAIFKQISRLCFLSSAHWTTTSIDFSVLGTIHSIPSAIRWNARICHSSLHVEQRQ